MALFGDVLGISSMFRDVGVADLGRRAKELRASLAKPEPTTLHCNLLDSNVLKPGTVNLSPEAPSYLNSRFLGCVTIGYIEPSSHYLGNWSPRVGL